MATKPLLPGKGGGNNHPIAVKQFILDRLALVGEDYYAGLHQAYKDELDRLAIEKSKDMSVPKNRRRTTFYHHPTYFSFFKKVKDLIVEGRVEYSGHEEESDDPRFNSWKERPLRKYVRLARRR